MFHKSFMYSAKSLVKNIHEISQFKIMQKLSRINFVSCIFLFSLYAACASNEKLIRKFLTFSHICVSLAFMSTRSFTVVKLYLPDLQPFTLFLFRFMHSVATRLIISRILGVIWGVICFCRLV